MAAAVAAYLVLNGLDAKAKDKEAKEKWSPSEITSMLEHCPFIAKVEPATPQTSGGRGHNELIITGINSARITVSPVSLRRAFPPPTTPLGQLVAEARASAVPPVAATV